MTKILKLITLTILILLNIFSFTSINTNALDSTQTVIPYNAGGLNQGIEDVKTSIKDIDTEGKASDKIQDIVKYLLGFITLVSVIYIIYAGFRILTSSGDDDTIKKSKNTIIYVIIGILVIWFAWTIANFAVEIGTAT